LFARYLGAILRPASFPQADAQGAGVLVFCLPGSRPESAHGLCRARRRAGACIVNLPAPERYAVHKLIVYGERPPAERAKATKDILQAAALAEFFSDSGQARVFNQAWRDALGRGPGWRRRALQGHKALLRLAPELGVSALWKH